jgi:hypothetical protein
MDKAITKEIKEGRQKERGKRSMKATKMVIGLGKAIHN